MSEYPSRLVDRWLTLELFTNFHRITGQLWTAELRTNGVLNSSDSQVLLERVTTTPLLRPTANTIESGFARINKNSIVMAVPNDSHEKDRLAQAARIYFRGELMQYRVLMVLGNFEISGNLHLEPELELTQVLLQREENFIGMTDVNINFLPNPALRVTANSVLINRSKVDFLCAGAP
ncbi:MAG: hypothetical protein J0I20_34580 [Chloroflexi bacterium]|nr:hypothetical protein [Chloroflexota bacterium]OJV89859.1 MAG: hypothetical protein BGO39_00695 [Chloroflexi bacterium 54-19]